MEIDDSQIGFIIGRSNTDAIFILMEKYIGKSDKDFRHDNVGGGPLKDACMQIMDYIKEPAGRRRGRLKTRWTDAVDRERPENGETGKKDGV